MVVGKPTPEVRHKAAVRQNKMVQVAEGLEEAKSRMVQEGVAFRKEEAAYLGSRTAEEDQEVQVVCPCRADHRLGCDRRNESADRNMAEGLVVGLERKDSL